MPWTKSAGRKGAHNSPIPQMSKPVPIPPPKGMNLEDPLMGMTQNDCVLMINYISAKYGDKVRTGYQQYATTVGTGAVQTIIPYYGSITTHDRLFAAGRDGIYDISASVATPTAKLAFSSTTPNSGQGIWCANTTIGGFFSIYCDEDLGYFLYTESTDSWAVVTNTQVTGVDPATFCFCTAFKERLWFVQKNTASAWFLATGANLGAATQFNFGNKFRKGGTLQALYTWTTDGSNGPDNYLVAVSSSGEVLVYKGNDPTDATNFFQVGSWFIGPVPVGRRIGGSFGGDLYLLSSYGLQPISRLIQGGLAQTDAIELSRKISPAIQDTMALTLNNLGWEVKLVPSENGLYIGTPDQVGFPHLQYVMSTNNQGWSEYNSLPMFTGEVWHGTFYMGALDGNVYTHTGNSDNVPISGVGTGAAIAGYIITSFQDYGEYGLFHIPHIVRPVFVGSSAPSYQIDILFDYNLNFPPSMIITTPSVGTLWDLGVWDVGVWTGASVESEPIVGVGGIGRAIAIALQTLTTGPATLIRFDALAETGGFF